MNIPESMMIEPTESESKETLDNFVETLIEIDSLIRESRFLKIFLHSSVYLTKNNIQTTNNCDKI